LISYGPDFIDQFRQAASYVDRILKGEKPADLPVQAPTKYTGAYRGADLAWQRRRGDRITILLLHCMSPLLTQSAHP
jgi:hypothetical protein